jgi:hypothetical protein
MFQSLFNRSSLRRVLIVPYLLLIVVLAGILAALAYHAGSQSVNKVADSLLIDTVARIGQAIDRHVMGSGAVLETAFPDGMMAPDNVEKQLDALRSRFWVATTLHIDPNNYVYFGNRRGQSVGLLRKSLSDAELRYKLKPDEYRKIFTFSGISDQLTFKETESKLFDPRVRPWYVAGYQARNDKWTSVYVDFNTRELVATRARRVPAKELEDTGVVGTDMSLRALNEFVRKLKVSENGNAFIVEPSGERRIRPPKRA